MSTRRDWWHWSLGALAGLALGTWLSLSCGAGGAQSAEVQDAIQQASAAYGVPASRLFCLARRESGARPWAYSPVGPFHGMFQYVWSTWRWMSAQAGLAGTSPYDPYAASMVTSWAISRGMGHHWPPLRGCP